MTKKFALKLLIVIMFLTSFNAKADMGATLYLFLPIVTVCGFAMGVGTGAIYCSFKSNSIEDEDLKIAIEDLLNQGCSFKKQVNLVKSSSDLNEKIDIIFNEFTKNRINTKSLFRKSLYTLKRIIVDLRSKNRVLYDRLNKKDEGLFHRLIHPKSDLIEGSGDSIGAFFKKSYHSIFLDLKYKTKEALIDLVDLYKFISSNKNEFFKKYQLARA